MLLDAGGMLVANPAAPERPGEVDARMEVYAKAYAHMGYALVNVGAHELSVGVADLQKFAKSAKVTLLSANVRDAKTHEPVFQPSYIRQIGPLRVGFLGLVTGNVPNAGKLVLEPGLEVQPPVAAAKDLVPKLRAQGCDMVVVLSQLHRADVEAVANQVPGIDLILGSMDSELTMQPVTMGRQTLFVDAFTKGKYVTQVSVSVRGKRDRYWPANVREAISVERGEAANQVQTLVSELEAVDRPGSTIKLTPDTRKTMEQQLVAAKARLQRLTMQLDSTDGKAPPDASTVEVTQTPLSSDVPDDSTVDRWVKAFQVKFPKAGGGH
ncbi:MAG: hypothetical protein HY902_02135 [Deltaproteobacteria bacterium]|nr:hypothetical protein [Deltaproteobacteria bacterium]